jgi:hypothetical protein
MRRRFFIWVSALSAVWLFANWPRDGGALKFWMKWAGFPWTFAFWDDGQLEWFNWWALIGDLGVLLTLIPVAWLCAWSRRAGPQPTRM